jgi:cytoskeletal protein RodZ
VSSFGEELKRERELREIELREVAEATKVNIRYLEAIERNDFTHLPGGLFNKGFVRAYAQYIGVDPEAMVNAYLLEEQSQNAGVPVRDGVLRGRRDRSTSAQQQTDAGRASGASRWWLWGLGLALLVTVVLVVWFLAGNSGGTAHG